MHCGERTSIDGAVASTVVCVSPCAVRSYHANTRAPLPDWRTRPVGRSYRVWGVTFSPVRTRKIQFAAGKLFDSTGRMAVMISSRVSILSSDPLAKNEDSSTANSFEVASASGPLALFPGDPIETHLEVDVGMP